MRHSLSRALISGALLTTTALTAPALAQEASIAAFPIRQFQDENGVDLLSGAFTVMSPSLKIGGKDMGLTYVREIRANQFRDTMMWNINVSGSSYTVGIGTHSERFTLSGSTFTPVENNGSTLTRSGIDYTYTAADGTVATFSDSMPATLGNARGIVVRTIKYPNGRTLTYDYTTASYYDPLMGIFWYGRRLQGVTNNAGWQINFRYASDTFDGATLIEWTRMITLKGLNSAVDSCLPTAYSCPQTGRPQLDIAEPTPGTIDYTDAESRTTRYTITGSAVTGVRLPGSSSDDISVTYTSGRVTSITRFGVTTGYLSSDAGGVRTVTVTRPGGATRVVEFNVANSVMLSDRNELNHKTEYSYDGSNRLTRTTLPEDNYIELEYDSRGNATKRRAVPKPGSTLANIETTAVYPGTCTNALTCNQPSSTTDAKGNTTDYSYDTTHGGLLTVTAPAPTTGTTRPQSRMSYTRLAASGSPSGTGIFRPTGTSICQTGSAPSCVGTADEVKTTIAYGQGLLPSSVSTGAGDGSLVANQAMTYDVAGNLLTVDGPLSGTADTTRYRYNLNRELVGVIAPDPDGGSVRPHTAQRITYGSKGLVTQIELGTVAGLTDPNWAAFATHQEVQHNYDANRRPNDQRLVSGGTIYAVNQQTYDTRGRPDCSITRMNPSTWTGTPSCTLGTVSTTYGPDRISKTTYDAASQVTKVETARGTTDQADEVQYTYTDNGFVAYVRDAQNNLSAYQYDGFDRRGAIYYPRADGTNVNWTDYESYTFDANSNITNLRLRDNQNIGFTYDNLNRVTAKDVPNVAYNEFDITYSYDLLGRLTAASNSAGGYVTHIYDALSRMLTDNNQFYGKTLQYDLAGRMTRFTWADSNYVDYDYDVTGNVTAIRENGATSGAGVLVTYVYDDLGRRTGITRGNGTVASYGYDPVSRLSSLGENFAGTTHDFTLGFTYNPASQIATNSRSNDLFAWGGHYNRDKAETPNGLNQLTAQGSTSLTYDVRGNVSAIASTPYTYTSENRLATSPATSLYHDPVGRLLWSTIGIRYDLTGSQITTELNGATNATMRRYVWGSGTDEPIVWYEGSGMTDRRWLHADERGSIIAVSNGSGAVTNINSYEEYGVPAAGNVGRFQYTGQAWLPELGMHYYKNRIYNPGIGRFMQADPVGYAAGMNLYGYVSGDPVNRTDPLGLWDYCGGGYEGLSGDLQTVGKTNCSNFPDLWQLGPTIDFGGEIGGGSLVGPTLPTDVAFPNAEKPCQIPMKCENPTKPEKPADEDDGNCGKPLPPANRQYPVPEGYTAGPKIPGGGENLYIFDKTGALQLNPHYEEALNSDGRTDYRKSAIALEKIGGGTLFPLRNGAIETMGAARVRTR